MVTDNQGLTKVDIITMLPRYLSINTYGGTEIPVFRRRVAVMIERTVRIISIIKK